MISETAALEKILSTVSPTAEEERAPAEAYGRFACADLHATVPLPRFDNSSMDGYAVHPSDLRRGARLKVSGEQPAGRDRGLSVQPGEAIRIFTGAPVPAGTGAVVMQEDVSADGGWIRIDSEVEPNENIRWAGTDLAAGQKIVRAGQRLTPQLAALVASQGVARVRVHSRPRVAIISTGDELMPPGEPLTPGAIYESNGVLVQGLATELGCACSEPRIARDELPDLRKAIGEALGHDALILTGGVSVGARDLVKDVLRELGVNLEIWRVAVRPGKPFLFGRHAGCNIFGLPGNPVSVFVTFFCFVRPALLRLMGAESVEPVPSIVTAGESLSNPGDRPHYVRGRVEEGVFALAGRQESHALAGLSRSNALVRLTPGAEIAPGQNVRAFLLG